MVKFFKLKSKSTQLPVTMLKIILAKNRRLLSILRLAFFVFVTFCHRDVGGSSPPLTCSLDSVDDNDDTADPALQSMQFEDKTVQVYVQPDVTSFYKGEPPAPEKVKPKFNGLSGKFINMSNKHVSLYWENTATGEKIPMHHSGPFGAYGTATFPEHHFVFTERNQPDKVLNRFKIKNYPNNVYHYDPYYVEGDEVQTAKNLSQLSESELEEYNRWRKTISFNQQYLNFTGRSYLANYLRKPPIHHMWRADYFEQEHWVTTRETHFVKLPPDELLSKITMSGSSRVLKDHEPRLLQEYRDTENTVMNMTLKVLSCAPRLFKIENFLSQVEIDHILKIAHASDLKLSRIGDVGVGSKSVQDVRTSFNSWVVRETSPIIDAIYRRAADLMRIDESLLRHRSPEEHPELKSRSSLAEKLQLVHYDVAQQYTAHHDFSYSPIQDQNQGARFATLLLYLNKPELGGETSFPRWVNAETFREVRVKPVIGDAALFYSTLPDGNHDDFSQHAALPLLKGEKWLINMWVWNPVYKYG